MTNQPEKPNETEGPDATKNPELFDDYDFRPERKATPESEAYFDDLMSEAPWRKERAEAKAKKVEDPPDKVDK